MVRRVTFNPILKGSRVRNGRLSKRVNKSGRHKSVAAPPEEVLVRVCPHLAFIEPGRYDRLIRKLRDRGDKCRRGRGGADDSPRKITKKWQAWPGQHLCCGVCGNLSYWGGHGQAEHMMCAGAREHHCWNAATFDGVGAGQKLGTAILAEIEALDGFGPALLRKVRAKAKARQLASGGELKKVTAELERVRRKIERVQAVLLDGGKGSRTLAQTLLELEAEEDGLLKQGKQLAGLRQRQDLELPSMDRIKEMAREAISTLTAAPEFCARMLELVPVLKVLPYRLCDGGGIVLRAKAVLNLTSLVPEPFRVEELTDVLCRELTVDLFDPPQREQYRARVVSLRRAGVPEWKIARDLGLTVTAFQKAMALQRLMDERGLVE
jgi:site-specific DNA recombinase